MAIQAFHVGLSAFHSVPETVAHAVLLALITYTTEERDGMLQSGMEEGLNQSYVALDRVLATLA